MLDINGKIQEIKKITNKFSKEMSLEGEMLGIHESTTKLWEAFINGKSKDDLGKRIANVLIGVFILSDRLDIKNIEHHLQKRLEELKKEID